MCIYIVLNVRIDSKVKKEAAKVAETLGFTLSAVVNATLRNLIKTKSVNFSESYEPTPYLARIIKQARKDRESGKNMSPMFENMNDALAWLNKQK
jgi:addiction module RelB/DinJ family antitoxin